MGEAKTKQNKQTKTTKVNPYPSKFLTPEKFKHVFKEFHNDLIVALVIISDVLKWDNECYL